MVTGTSRCWSSHTWVMPTFSPTIALLAMAGAFFSLWCRKGDTASEHADAPPGQSQSGAFSSLGCGVPEVRRPQTSIGEPSNCMRGVEVRKCRRRPRRRCRSGPAAETQQVLLAVERVVVRPRTGERWAPEGLVGVETPFQRPLAPGESGELQLQVVDSGDRDVTFDRRRPTVDRRSPWDGLQAGQRLHRRGDSIGGEVETEARDGLAHNRSGLLKGVHQHEWSEPAEVGA